MIEQLIDELLRLKEAEDLLRTVLIESGEYGYRVKGCSDETLRRIEKFMDFDDSE